MKIKSLQWMLALWILIAPFHVMADPFVGADVNILPKDFAAISGIYTGGAPGLGWKIQKNAIYTLWQDNWVEYVVNIPSGKWNIGLNAINTQGTLGSDPAWYPRYEVKVQVYDVGEGMIYIAASDSVENFGHYEFNLGGGYYRIRFTWLNDQYDSATGRDADFKITGVFLDRTGDYVPPTDGGDGDDGGGGGGCFIKTLNE